MDIRIGVTHSSRDISLEVEGDEKSQAAVRKTVEEALAGKVEVLWMKDKRGREVAIPAEKIAFVEFDQRFGDHIGLIVRIAGVVDIGDGPSRGIEIGGLVARPKRLGQSE